MSTKSRPERKRIETDDPSLDVVVCDDGSRTLRCKRRDITWHSESGALAESQLVFLGNSGVAATLESGGSARVLEVGFGTGLNFWLTASLALTNEAELDYVAFEPYPLSDKILELLEYEKLEACAPAINSFPRIAGVTFRLVEKPVQDLESVGTFDAIYHDPFSPEAAPEMWSEDVFGTLLAVLRPGGKLVTYCVKSEIQRRLKGLGFEVSKTRGPVGGKREVLIATKLE